MEADRLVIRIDVEGRDAQREVEGVSRALRGLSGSARQGARGLHEASRASRQTEANFKQLSHTARQVQHAIRMVYGALAAYAGLQVAQSIARMADQYQLLSSRLRLVSASAQQFRQAQEQLYQIAQRTRADLGATYEIYTRLANATREFGTSQQELLRVVETLNSAILVSGASAQEAQAALLQLSQAMASGRLQGDELRSVLEQMPILGRAIAQEMGVSIGALRELGSQGQITTQVILRALDHVYDQMKARAAEIPMTVQQSFQVLENSWARLIGESKQLGGIFDTVKAAALALAKTFDQIRVGELSGDFKVLGTIGEQVILGLISGTSALAQAFLSLKAVWQYLKLAFYKLEDVIASGLKSILDHILSVLEYINDNPIGDKLVPDSLVRNLRETSQYLGEWGSKYKESVADTKRELEETFKQIDATRHVTENLIKNFQQFKEDLKKAGDRGEEAFKKTGRAAEKVANAIGKGYDALKLFNLELKRQEEISRATKRLDEIFHQLYLKTLPEGERQIEEIRDRYTELIAEAAKMAAITQEWEKYNQIVNLALNLQDKEITALNETVQIHKDKAEQIKQIWDDTYKGLGDTLAEWIVEFNFDLNSITDLFRFMSKRILSTWIETWIKMQVVQMQATGGGLFGSLIKAIPFIGGLFSGGAAAGPVEVLTIKDLNLVPAYHKGGVVGETPAPMRLVPSYIFNNAPRLHSGLLPNEFPAILERGEVVIPRLFWNEFLKQINTKVDKRTFNINVNVYVPTRQYDAEQANLSASHIGYKVAEAIKNFVIIQE